MTETVRSLVQHPSQRGYISKSKRVWQLSVALLIHSMWETNGGQLRPCRRFPALEAQA